MARPRGQSTIKTRIVKSMKDMGTYSKHYDLRKDIITYSDRLGLNPKAVGIEPPKAKDAGRLEGMIANII